MEVRFTNKPAKICMRDTHFYIIIILWTEVLKTAHLHHHHEDAGDGHEDVGNGHDGLVSRDGQSHGCGRVGHQNDAEHEEEEGLSSHFQTYTQNSSIYKSWYVLVTWYLMHIWTTEWNLNVGKHWAQNGFKSNVLKICSPKFSFCGVRVQLTDHEIGDTAENDSRDGPQHEDVR